MTKPVHDWLGAGTNALPQSYADIARLVRDRGAMETSRPRRAWSHALARMIEHLDDPDAQDIEGRDMMAATSGKRLHRLEDAAAIKGFRRYLDLRSASATVLLLWLAENPDVFHERKSLQELLDCSEGSLKVFVWEIRRSFRDKGFRDPIRTVYGKGYCIPAETARAVRRLRTALAENGVKEAALNRMVHTLRRNG